MFSKLHAIQRNFVLSDVMTYGVVEVHWRFGGAYSLRLYGRKYVKEANMQETSVNFQQTIRYQAAEYSALNINAVRTPNFAYHAVEPCLREEKAGWDVPFAITTDAWDYAGDAWRLLTEVAMQSLKMIAKVSASKFRCSMVLNCWPFGWIAKTRDNGLHL
jgi:hypothetical protein